MKMITRDRLKILRNSAKVMLGSERYDRDFIVRQLAKISLAIDGDETEDGARELALKITEATIQNMDGKTEQSVANQEMVLPVEDDLQSSAMLEMDDLVDDSPQL